MKDYDAAITLGISNDVLDERMRRISRKDRTAIEDGRFTPYEPSKDIINKFEENALRLGVPNPYIEAEPVIDGIQSLIEVAPLSLEMLPEIENPFRSNLFSSETQIDLGAAANLNNVGAGITGGDLLAGVSIPNTGELPFEQLNLNQKIAKGKNVGFGKPGDITFGS
tara:strand:- start:50 stop:550 length:501 start_codon:yes stop_codon:yes gene_type:complete